jgi:hypothetical protein
MSMILVLIVPHHQSYLEIVVLLDLIQNLHVILVQNLNQVLKHLIIITTVIILLISNAFTELNTEGQIADDRSLDFNSGQNRSIKFLKRIATA